MQVAALWALRNFALVEAHRQRMTAMRVIDQSLALLSSTSAPPGVKHAAAALLQTLSTAAPDTVRALTAAGALPKLVGFLYGRHKCVACPSSCRIGVLLQITTKGFDQTQATAPRPAGLAGSCALLDLGACVALHLVWGMNFGRFPFWVMQAG